MSTLYESAFQKAEELHGEVLDQTDDERLRILCVCTVDLLQKRLRTGVKPEDCLASFTSAAGMLALSMMHTVEAGGNLTSLDAGTLSLHFDNTNNRMAQIAKELIAPWCDGGTAFVGVRA